jgi:hypothetical protein
MLEEELLEEEEEEEEEEEDGEVPLRALIHLSALLLLRMVLHLLGTFRLDGK